MANVLTALVGGLGGKIVDVVDKRAQRKANVKLAAMEGETKKLELAHNVAKEKALAQKEGRAYQASWEELAWKNSGWKDEFWTIWAGGLVIAMCIPWLGPYVQAGLQATTLWPPEFRFAVVALILSSIGIRWTNGK